MDGGSKSNQALGVAASTPTRIGDVTSASSHVASSDTLTTPGVKRHGQEPWHKNGGGGSSGGVDHVDKRGEEKVGEDGRQHERRARKKKFSFSHCPEDQTK